MIRFKIFAGLIIGGVFLAFCLYILLFVLAIKEVENSSVVKTFENKLKRWELEDSLATLKARRELDSLRNDSLKRSDGASKAY